MKALLSSLFIFTLLSCNNISKSDIFSESKLEAQEFTINNDRDTTLITKNGCFITISAGSFKSQDRLINIKVKEAIKVEDMILAGLRTMSDGSILSSNGMIYINSENSNVSIVKPLKVLIPSPSYNSKMKVYRGVEKDGKINWVNPVGLPDDTLTQKIKKGEQLYKNNCQNCHKISTDYTGPLLDNVTERRSKKWLYDFTRNPAQMIATDASALCLLETWKPTVMTSFESLTDKDLDALYGYIKSVSSQNKTEVRDSINCCEECARYSLAVKQLSFSISEPLVTLERNFRLPDNVIFQVDPSNDANALFYERVSPTDVRANFYTVNIDAFGWHNLDLKFDEINGCKMSSLNVDLGSSIDEVKLFLIIPSHRVFAEGGLLKNNKEYGFDAKDGSLMLPQKQTCYILAIGEDDESLRYGVSKFIAQQTQKIEVKLQKGTDADLVNLIKSLNLDQVSIKTKKVDPKLVNDKAEQQRLLDSLGKTIPRNCNCGDSSKDLSK
jgi:mono/diheme cytochrome c family protein